MTEDMTRCSCGLIVSNDKMKMHMESEHEIKILSDLNERSLE